MSGSLAVSFAARCPACGAEATFVSVGVPDEETQRTRLDRVAVDCPTCERGTA